MSVHATIAGVLVGLLVPVAPRLHHDDFVERVQERVDEFQDAHRQAKEAASDEEAEEAERQASHRLGYIREMTNATDETSERVIVTLTPWVSYVVLPLFALSNVPIHFAPELFHRTRVAAGTRDRRRAGARQAAGVSRLCRIGEPARLGGAARGRRLTMVGAIGALAGIDFTISLFIAGAFGDGEQREVASLAIPIASLVSDAIGYPVLARATR
jgi:NhaA family Na+:H+ antiporter